jgi:hypothetical protein
MTGAYDVHIASFSSPEFRKRLIAILRVDAEDGYSLRFRVNVGAKLCAHAKEFTGLAAAIRYYDKQAPNAE